MRTVLNEPGQTTVLVWGGDTSHALYTGSFVSCPNEVTPGGYGTAEIDKELFLNVVAKRLGLGGLGSLTCEL